MKRADVFINCPFSDDYRDFFNAIVFTIVRSGFVPRCALELNDGAVNRFEKICKIIEDCSYAVHDISKTELDKKSGLPRFNMPLELGVFLGAKRFGNKNHSTDYAWTYLTTAAREAARIDCSAGKSEVHPNNRARLVGGHQFRGEPVEQLVEAAEGIEMRRGDAQLRPLFVQFRQSVEQIV